MIFPHISIIAAPWPSRFVMWVRGTGYGNTPQLLGVLTSASPTGKFSFVHNSTNTDPFHTIASGIKNFPDGYQFADATLFQVT